jgi:large subunit ribosomal protein L31
LSWLCSFALCATGPTSKQRVMVAQHVLFYQPYRYSHPGQVRAMKNPDRKGIDAWLLTNSKGFPMKDGIHPNYREVCFQDLSNGWTFVTRSCAPTRENITIDGRELPLIKLETTSETHPFYTGTQKSIDNLGGRVEKFRNKFAHLKK